MNPIRFLFKTQTLTLSLVSSLSFYAQAQLVQMTCDDPDAMVGGVVKCSTLYAGLEGKINENLPSVETGQYTKGVANANAMASAGTGVVYGSSFRYGLVGVGVGLGVDVGEGNSLTDFDAKKFAGFGAQASAILGFNPGSVTTSPWLWGKVDPSRMRIYLSFLSNDRDFDDVNAKMKNFGIVGQYRIVAERSVGLSVLKWGGVDVATGLKYSNLELGYSTEINESFEAEGQGISADGPAVLAANSKNFSIPLEVSTSARLLYVLNLVGGLGADLNFGKTTASATFNPEITSDSDDANADGTGTANVGSDSSPAFVNMRAFFGTQFEFAIGSLYLNIQKSLNSGVWGTNVGLNFFW